MSIDLFVDFLLAYNQKVNLVSRQSTRETVAALIAETLLLQKHISTKLIIDAGSGNGLLGIPLAVSLPGKKLVLIETIQKKTEFLVRAVNKLGLKNVMIWNGPIQDFMRRHTQFESTVISRGFPKIEILAEYIFEKKVRELLLITAVKKIEKLRNNMAYFRQNRYNIPSRDNLIIYKLENVSRETQEKWVKS